MRLAGIVLGPILLIVAALGAFHHGEGIIRTLKNARTWSAARRP